MKILFDQGVPVPLRGELAPHVVETAFERGWHRLQNGALIAAAEAEQFDRMLSTDQNLKYQQNLTNRTIGILVLTTTSWPRIQKALVLVRDAVNASRPGGYDEIHIP